MIQACKNKWLPLSAPALGMALSFSANVNEQKSVVVTAIVEYPALDAARNGVEEALQEAGHEGGRNLKWQYWSAQGDTGTVARIACKFIGDKPDVIVGIATPSAQALMAATKSISIVFSIVIDPVGAHLTPSWKVSGTNVTGVSNMLALDKQIKLIKKVVLGIKRIGVVYNPGEANSVVVVKELKESLPKMGPGLVEASALHSVDVSPAVRSLVGGVDAIYTSINNNVVSAYEALVKVGNDAKIPLIASDTDSTKRGAIAAPGINHREMGRQTGRMVVHILKGERPGEIKPEINDNLQLSVNSGAAQKQGVTLSDELFKSAAEVIK